MRTEVLIVGAGPTGMALALWLTKQGCSVHIIEKLASTASRSRAIVVQARILELYRQLDLADAVVAGGHKTEGMNLWSNGEHKARLPLGDIGKGLTPYPYVQVFPQDLHEQLLDSKLKELGVTIQRSTELVDYIDYENRVNARVRPTGSNGPEETIEASYIIGCDGAHSAVRHNMNVEFGGGTYQQLFYVADIEGSGPTINGDAHISFKGPNFLLIFGFGDRRARLVGILNEEASGKSAETLTFDDVSRTIIDDLKIQVDKVNWFSPYNVHHRVANKFRKGRAFIVGDAAHIHSPVGGQGMNTGIGDAINLAWKLAAVLKGHADDSLLDTYEVERAAFAQRLVQTTDRAFNLATTEGWIADTIRSRVLPFVMPIAASMNFTMDFIFRTVSQTMLNYRGMPLAEGRAGSIAGGDRLPWIAATEGEDNFESLKTICWQAHVYGTPKDGLVSWCRMKGLPLHTFVWTPQHQAAGLAQNAVYLLRPDTYVAVADPAGDPQVIDKFLSSRAIRVIPGSPAL